MTVASALLSIVANAQTRGGITFVVDEDLAPIEEEKLFFLNGEQMATAILNGESIRQESHNIIATSFADAQCLGNPRKDAFFRCIVEAYSKHKSIKLSPDMIWLLISQGFARYVNAHAEELRPQLVNHEGKMDLVIASQKDLFSADTDWTKLVEGFSSQIDRHTKGHIAKILTADFSTTGPIERVASQVTLMESVKSYFEYLAIYLACGIPNITIEGTPDDWKHVLEKTKLLEGYGLGRWTQSLEPILTEFIRAAEGQPNRKFWQEMVLRQPADKLKGGACSLDKPTELDGWVLKFFPDENGLTPDHVPHNKEMPSERVRVGFKYHVLDPMQGTVINETSMELVAGFIGTEVDTITNTLSPKIGWLVRKAQTDEELLNEFEEQNDAYGLELRVKEVPEVVSRLGHIKRLRLIFTAEVTLPDWFFRMDIDELIIEGKASDELKARILKHFPKATIKTGRE